MPWLSSELPEPGAGQDLQCDVPTYPWKQLGRQNLSSGYKKPLPQSIKAWSQPQSVEMSFWRCDAASPIAGMETQQLYVHDPSYVHDSNGHAVLSREPGWGHRWAGRGAVQGSQNQGAPGSLECLLQPPLLLGGRALCEPYTVGSSHQPGARSLWSHLNVAESRRGIGRGQGGRTGA